MDRGWDAAQSERHLSRFRMHRVAPVSHAELVLTDATTTGARVLAGFAKGRARAIAQKQALARELRRIVAQKAREDATRGNSERGRAARIARELRGLVSERHVRNILSELLMSISDSTVHVPFVMSNGHTHE